MCVYVCVRLCGRESRGGNKGSDLGKLSISFPSNQYVEIRTYYFIDQFVFILEV